MPIDLRSDTVTRPTPAMREAMAHAEVGDDVFGEDPTANALEARIAAVTGKEAAVFVPSGTMGNLSSVLAHCQRGQEAIVGDESHVFHYESGGSSALGGVVLHTVHTDEDGTLPLASLEEAIRPPGNVHFAQPGVICLENTHNRRGGVVLSPAYFEDVARLAGRHNLPVHLDGARIFNAATAAGRPVTAWTDHVTSVQLCLSKGLGAPVGSVVAGPRAFADRVRHLRRMLGGGMRQAGVIAAAGLIALDKMVGRLADDHANARELATGLAKLPGIRLDPGRVQTNIVLFRLAEGLESSAFLHECQARGVLLSYMGSGLVRAVTHADVSREQCRQALPLIEAALKTLGAPEQSRREGAFDALQGRR